MMKRPRPRPKAEPTVALINIVFLMLVFFMVASTLAQPLGEDLKLLRTEDFRTIPPPDALVIQADGRMSYRGNPTTVELFVSQDVIKSEIRLVPDRNLPARELLRISSKLRGLGVEKLTLVAETQVQE